MSGRKILVLIDSGENALECVNFVANLFRGIKLLMVVGFVEDEHSGSVVRRNAIVQDLQQAYSAHPNIRLMIRNGRILSFEDIARESGYTDLIVMEADVFRKTYAHELSGIAADAAPKPLNVPLIIVPEEANEVEEVLITFDGQLPSVNSIKQFCQIMGGLCAQMQVTLLETNHDSKQFLPQEEKLLIEYLQEHCENLGVYKVSDESPDRILQLVNSSRNSIVVAGALDSLQSSLGHLSKLSNQLIEQNNLPGFFGAS